MTASEQAPVALLGRGWRRQVKLTATPPRVLVGTMGFQRVLDPDSGEVLCYVQEGGVS